ncbi:Uma2 family endonuclease [Breznakiellaceae bacterium SP9]
MPNALMQEKTHYTFADYRTWDEGYRAEIIDGELYELGETFAAHDGTVYEMATPTLKHQGISVELCRQIANYLEGKPCRVFSAPVTVVPFAEEAEDEEKADIVLEPDLIVVCDESKLEDWGCNGAPDWVIEILSKSTGSIDRNRKYQIYEAAGVREYWIVDPVGEIIEQNVLAHTHYTVKKHDKSTPVQVAVLPGLAINVAKVFPPSPRSK